MCLVIDTCCFSSVFNPKSEGHSEFAPVLKWLFYGDGARLIYGGTKYEREVNFKKSPYLRLITELEKKGRLLHLKNSEVDEVAESIKAFINDSDFDDEHIVAMVIVSRCCIVCTNDKRADRFIKNRMLYPNGMKPPRIYRTRRHKKLCCPMHVTGRCLGD